MGATGRRERNKLIHLHSADFEWWDMSHLEKMPSVHCKGEALLLCSQLSTASHLNRFVFTGEAMLPALCSVWGSSLQEGL